MSSSSSELARKDYLWDFEEASVEKPADDLNGECTIHYVGNFDGYTMKVKLDNGKREGEAVIYKDNGNPHIKLNYEDGKLNGTVEVMNDKGRVVSRGHLVNGMEKGLFRDYYGSLTTWVGYYREGYRYSSLRKSVYLKGFYEEYSVETGKLLSIAEYDGELTDKCGYCIECEDGGLKEWIIKDGVKEPVIREYDDTIEIWNNKEKKRKRDVPGKRDVDSPKRFCLNPSSYESRGSLILYNIYDEYEYGTLRMKDICYVIKRSGFENRILEANLKTHSFRVCENNVWKKNNAEEGCIDLDVNGKRWEGGVKGGKPFGWGVLYDGEGKKEYEGFMMGDVKQCYGKEFFEDIERVHYEGCYYSNQRFADGTLYDRNGNIEYKGDLVYDPSNSLVTRKSSVSNVTQFLKIPNNVGKGLYFFSLTPWAYSLKEIEIGDNSCCKTQLCDIVGLGALEKIVIGKNSFSNDSDSDEEDDSKEVNSICRIRNCDKLKSIRFDESSLGNYCSFELKNLPSLQSIETGSECFFYASSLSLNDLPQLQSIVLGERSFYSCTSFVLSNAPSLESIRMGGGCFKNAVSFSLTKYCVILDLPNLQSVDLYGSSFMYCHSVVFENLPKLESIQLSDCVFLGDNDDNRMAIENEPYNYKNTLTMRNLPSLVSFIGGDDNFMYIGSVILENIPKLLFNEIVIGSECFSFTYSIKSTSTYFIVCSPLDATNLDCFITSHSDYLPTGIVSPSITEWIVENGMSNKAIDTALTLSGSMHLKRMVIGDDCYGYVRSFGIDGLNELESIVIGEKSFTYVKSEQAIDKMRTDGSCRIANCPKLVSIQIGEWSFSDYKSLEMNHLPSLQSIEMGKMCFFNGGSFSLTDCLHLESLSFCSFIFQSCESVVFENLPELQFIDFASHAFEGNAEDNQKTVSDKPYKYKNTFTMKNLPSLVSFTGENYNFQYVGSAFLENIPLLLFGGIQFYSNCFNYVCSLQSSSTHSLHSSPIDASGFDSFIRSRSAFIPIDISESISPNARKWIVSDDKYQAPIQPLVLSNGMRLKQIMIESDCLSGLRSIELNGLSELESIQIGEYCFTKVSRWSKENVIPSDGSCRILNCPKLKSIVINDYSFSDYLLFEMANCPSLQSIEMGDNCFRYASAFSLVDFPNLQSVKLGRLAFTNAKSVTFESHKVVNVIE